MVLARYRFVVGVYHLMEKLFHVVRADYALSIWRRTYCRMPPCRKY